MKDNQKKYWKGIEQLSNDPEFVKHADKEFPEYLPINGNDEGGSSRRDFLKMMGFGIAAASLAACEAPIRKAIPYVNKPMDIDPGVANYYASTYAIGGDYCSMVIKTREGRPIFIEGNKQSKISCGGVGAQVQASVLTLYDNERLKNPVIKNEKATWESLDKEVSAALTGLNGTGKKISIVTNTILSPSTKAVLEDFKNQYPTAEVVTYDTSSAAGMIAANSNSFGKSVISSYDFSKADVIVSFGADFLGTWISHEEFTKQYAETRKIGDDKKTMSRHYQFEANLSLTGANADYRSQMKPSQEGLAVAYLYNQIAKGLGKAILPTKKVSIDRLDDAAKALLKAKGKSLVVSGSNDPDVQTIVNAINNLLGNYGNTIDIEKHANYRQGNDKAFAKFVTDAAAGNVGAVIFYNCNPIYDSPLGKKLKNALSKVKLKVSTADRMDETAVAVDYVAPDHHYMESWNDAEPKAGTYSFTQPVISPLFDTRQVQDTLLKWTGNNTSYYDYLKGRWEATYQDFDTHGQGFQYFWDSVLMDGVVETKHSGLSSGEEALDEVNTSLAFSANLSAVANKLGKNYKADNDGLELVIYQKGGIGDGRQANNPWLQEMPDPVSKATWDNYLTVSQKFAEENGITMFEGKANMVELTVGNQVVKVPVLIQPGQANGTVGLAVGYGRTNAGKVANGVGVNAYPFIRMTNGFANYAVTSGISVNVLDEKYQIAQTQTHQTYMGRETVIQESVLSEYKKDPSAGRHHPHIANWLDKEGTTKPDALSLWKGHKYNNHHWGLVIDLNLCTGCSACTIACHSENNVPVVGREEVINRRDMHWLRIDRYYSSDAEVEDHRGLEIASQNPEVVFQPMMCQHCNNAPCETVCPVAATTHSTEGLNQMTYNRCIGTRYCANNCPYKVRRFNWFKYHDNKQFEVNTAMSNDLGKMVLNPDVTVRSRGVMEKCSFCVQRIQEGKLKAKKEGRRPADEDFNVACSSSCSSQAMVFGDMNDPNSKISKLLKVKDIEGDYGIDKQVEEPRAYHVLEEIGVKPNVMYLTKIRNKDKKQTEA